MAATWEFRDGVASGARRVESRLHQLHSMGITITAELVTQVAQGVQSEYGGTDKLTVTEGPPPARSLSGLSIQEGDRLVVNGIRLSDDIPFESLSVEGDVVTIEFRPRGGRALPPVRVDTLSVVHADGSIEHVITKD